MAYNRNGYQQPYQQPYNISNYGNNGQYNQQMQPYNGANQQMQQQRKKHSGCSSKQGKNGKHVVFGWNYSRRNGMVKLLAGPYKNSRECKSKSGNVFVTWMLQVTKPMAEPYAVPCLYHPATDRVICQSLSLVMNPRAPNRGYCGKFFRGKNRN